MTDEEIIQKTELVFLEKLAGLMENGMIDLDEAKEAARKFLSLYPFASLDDIKAKLKQFIDENSAYTSVFIDLQKYIDSENAEKLEQQLADYVKANS